MFSRGFCCSLFLGIALTLFPIQTVSASFAFFLETSQAFVSPDGTVIKTRLLAINTMSSDAQLSVFPSPLVLTVDSETGTNVTGDMGLNGQISTTFSSGLVAVGDTIEIALLTFSDTGGALNQVRSDSFSLALQFGVDGVAPGAGENLFSGSVLVSVPEPITATTFVFALVCVSGRRRR